MSKRFPANTSLDENTFLNTRTINGELYAYLQSLSIFGKNNKAIVRYRDLPAQRIICERLKIKSPKTYRTHLNYLIDAGYVEEAENGYVLPEMENIYVLIPEDTLNYLCNNCQDHVIKIYIYLGQRYKYSKEVLNRDYEFSLDEIAQHLGLNITHNQKLYEVINNALELLSNSGLIEYCQYYDGKVRKKKLLSFNFEYKKPIG